MKRKITMILSIVLAAVLLLAACAPHEVAVDTKAKTDGPVFGDFKTQDLAGNEVTQDVFAGKKLTMVNMWATYCKPCLAEMPDLAQINKEYADKGFQVVGLVTDVTDQSGAVVSGQIDLAKEIVSKTGADYTQIIPSEVIVLKKLKDVTMVPETVFVDENGNQVGESVIGSRSKQEWIKLIDGLLGESGEA
ncbi:MAG: TlpA disulfide reductase family protein [Christensenella sp.]|uniref:TlpA family protein disulfide reductase n=1 Tax=Christensenella sp. TaxID=1935934 RepID=UPI002B21F6D1|nr:TlpA disulfide reductase family protein [Christensenella sp.]MEA5002659.1 TlpA disulfide reductase family protein [Christensenella sp.]